jgi:hypothetical protein
MRRERGRRGPATGTILGAAALVVALSSTQAGNDVALMGKRLITGHDIRDGSVTTADVRDHSLLASDFANGQLPAGATGPQGPRGLTGTVDTSQFYDKTASDGRFLGMTGKAADADKLDGLDSTGFVRPIWVVVNADGSIARQRGADGVSMFHPATGYFHLSGFGTPMDSCAVVATLGHLDNTNVGADDDPGMVVARPAYHTDSVSVLPYTSAGAHVDRGFTLAVIC